MLFSKPVIPLATLLLAAHLASASLIVREPGKNSGEPTPAFVSAPPIPKEMYEGLTKTPSTTKQTTTTVAVSRRDVDTAANYTSTSQSSPISLSSTPSPTPEEILVSEQDTSEDDDEQDEMCDDNDHGRKVKRAPVAGKTPPKPNAGGNLGNGLWWKRTPRTYGSAKQAVPVEAPYPVPQNATGSAGQQQGYVTGTASIPIASGAPVRRSGPDGSRWKRAPVRNNAKQAIYAGQGSPPYQNATSGAGQQQGHTRGTASVLAPSGAPIKRAGGAGSGYGVYSSGGAGNGTGAYQGKAQGGNPTAIPPAWASSAAHPYATGSGNPNNGGSRTGKVRRELYSNDFATCQKDSYPKTKWLSNKKLTCCCPDQYETLSSVLTNGPVCKDLANGIYPAPQLPVTTVKTCKEGWKVSEMFPDCCEAI